MRGWPRVRLGWALVAAVLFATAGSALWRTHLFTQVPAYDPRSDRLLFWTESAFHYRYAAMAARGEPIPDLDRRAEMPDGVRPFRQFTIGMELVSGGLYRALSRLGLIDVPFHVFLVRFICWFSSLSIPAVYLAARALPAGPGASAAAACLYALTPVSYHRVIGNFGLEDFALPLLFMFAAFFLRTLGAETKRDRWIAANAAGLFAAAGLAVWHLSRFFFLAFFPAAVVLALLDPRRERLRTALWATTIWQAAASLVVPVLVEKQAVLSSGLLPFAALAAGLTIGIRRGWSPVRTVAAAAVLSVVLLAAARAVSTSIEYSHVSSLIRYKLLYLGAKPDDPTLLPFDARVLSSPPFNSPGGAYLVTVFGAMILWGAAAIAVAIARAIRRRSGAIEIALLYLSFAFLLFFLLIERLSVFPVFFLAVLGAGLFRPPGGGARRGAVQAALLLTMLGQAAENARGPSSFAAAAARAWFPVRGESGVPNYGNNRRLVEWIRAFTGPDEVFLTWYPTGSTILLYADRPIVLHSKFESSVIRDRYKALLEALYGNEEEMASFCDRHRADYFVFQANLTLDLTKDSETYRIGLRGLPASSCAFLMHFRPEALERFALVYQDSYYRVFRREDREAGAPFRAPLPREAVWDRVRPAGSGTYADEAALREILDAMRTESAFYDQAASAYLKGDLTNADLYLEDVLSYSPDSEAGLLLRARIVWLRGRPDDALRITDEALEKWSASAELWLLKGEILLDLKRPVRAGKALSGALRSNPDHPEARRLLAKLEGAIEAVPPDSLTSGSSAPPTAASPGSESSRSSPPRGRPRR